MLAGHYAPALLAKTVAPDVPLWALFVAAQAVDFLYFALVFAGAEGGVLDPGSLPRFYVTEGMWSHSLLMTGVYMAVIAGAGVALRRRRAGLVLAAVVGSHWLTDLVVHIPDLPLTLDQATAVGLGLWRLPVLPWLLECGLVIAATWWLLRDQPRRRLITLGAGLVVLQTLSELVIPLPSDDVALGLSALPVYVGAAAAAWWAERGRLGSP